MINSKKYNLNLSIQKSILLLILLPSFLITAVLTTYLIISRQSDAQNELLLQVNSALNYLLNSSELPMFSGDKRALARLGNGAISNAGIKSVIIYDAEKNIISRSGDETDTSLKHSLDAFYSEENNGEWMFQTPVLVSEIDVDDYSEEKELIEQESPPKYLGWVQVIADKRPLQIRQNNILLAGFAIGSLLFGILTFLTLLFSRSLTNPLHSLTNTVRKLEHGDLDARVSVEASGELKALVFGVNQLADKVKVSNTQLNYKVKEATQRLNLTLAELEARNIALEMTGNQLIDANKAKDEFLASVSHELRTPLTSILGYARLLKKSELANEQVNQVKTISQASEILLHLIDNILDFSKLESESLELEWIPFNLNQLLDDLYALHLPAAIAKGIKLHISTDKSLKSELVGDPFRIKQVFNNLIHNAIKFTNKGSVTISVSELDNSFGLIVKVKDTGIGIKKENQANLFKPFNQLNTSTTRHFGGTGLGLVICKKLVTQLGGNITVNSKKGVGTEIVFSLLNITHQEDVKQVNLPQHKKSQQLDEKVTLAGKLILIAEDNEFVSHLLTAMFKHEGAKVIAKANGALALDELKNQKPDLVVLDYHMPILDGVDTCQSIRKQYSQTELPVILLTADVININKAKMKEIGFDDIIFKPIQGDELINCACSLVSVEQKLSGNKVLDFVSDDLLNDELKRLQCEVIKRFEISDNKNLKKYIHQLCGIAGPSTQHAKLWEVAKNIDLKLTDQNYDDLTKYIDDLKSISI